jgi:hypothetical protein
MAGDFERMTRSSPNMQYTCIGNHHLLETERIPKKEQVDHCVTDLSAYVVWRKSRFH